MYALMALACSISGVDIFRKLAVISDLLVFKLKLGPNEDTKLFSAMNRKAARAAFNLTMMAFFLASWFFVDAN